jgi:predicted amidophosphoribosyltransferase
MSEHFKTLCRNCGAVVEQCRCPGPKTVRYVEFCESCMAPSVGEHPKSVFVKESPMEMVYSYDRSKQADTGPASRLKNAVQLLHQGDHPFEQAKGILNGLVSEMGLVAHHTSDHKLKANFEHVQKFAHQLTTIDAEIHKLLAEMDHVSRSFG